MGGFYQMYAAKRRSSGRVLIEYVTLFQQGDDTLGTRKELLIGQRDRLGAKIEEMTTTLLRLDDKIARYERLNPVVLRGI